MKSTVLVIIGIIVFFMGLFSFVACRKDYSCDCVYIEDNKEYSYSFPVVKLSKKDSEKYCNEQEKELATLYSMPTMECTLN